MKRIVGALLLLWAAIGPAAAQVVSQLPIPFFQGPNDPAAMLNYLNIIISDVNNILLPIIPPPGGGASASASLSFPQSSLAGQPAVLTTTGTAANVSLAITPKGNGSIILFNNGTDTGLLQIANAPSWFPANGVDRCPGYAAGNAPVAGTLIPNAPGALAVRQYLTVKDWMGRPFYLPGCA